MSTAENEASAEFVAEFLDDYFAESEEHLMVLRRDLLTLEQYVNDSSINRQLLDSLSRSFHSLKGISGMVGLREAEQLAHHLESYLRILRDGQATLTLEGMDGLMSGTKMLEQVIAARREQTPFPDIAPLIALMEGLVGEQSPSEKPEFPRAVSPPDGTTGMGITAADVAEEPIAGDIRLWTFEFTPTPALAESGININVVRERLQKLGDLRSSVPRVLPGGNIAFEFTVAGNCEPSAFASLEACGVTVKHPQKGASSLAETAIPAANQDGKSAAAAPTAGPSSSSVVRVNLNRLDKLMWMVGDLVISRARLEENLKQAESSTPAPIWRALQETSVQMERQLRDLRENVMRVRMVPVGEIFERMRFVVRDLSREFQKTVRLEVRGQDTEIDKLLVERLMDPLMHLVRNAISHGLETPAEREAAGKSPAGVIHLRAFTEAEMVVIEVEDDGRGIHREQVLKRAREIGVLTAQATSDDSVMLDDEELLELISSPGFSTQKEADRASGRGVGMAVVKNTVLGLGGEFTLETEVDRGTRFTLRLPITLAIADALIVLVGGQKFAVPLPTVREVIEVDPASVKQFEGNEVMQYRGSVLPILRLTRLFRLAERRTGAFHAFIVGVGVQAAGIAVDKIVGQREIVVRAIQDPLIQVPGIAGATELGDGRAVLILDPVALVKRSSNQSDR